MAEKSISIDKAWEILFDRHDIAKQVAARGSFRISSADINTVKEARLMAKFDQSTQLPAIFKENKLSILPISRGEYIIGGFETHAKIKYDSVRPTPVPVPNLQTIDYTNLYSESSALLFAYNSGIIADILGGEAVFTVNGRMSSGSFSYWVRNNRLPAGEQHLDVVNAQVEIDAGYESRDALMLCEAKNVAVDELLIRQLYYPYRLWSSKISKPILPVFLVYSNDVFHAFIYRFFDREFYNSLELVEHKAYTFADEDIHLKDVVDIWNSIQCTEEPPITFPQADTFSRIVDILSVLYEKTMTPEEVTLKYDFDARQTSYYISACEYLGLLYRDTNEYGERQYTLSREAKSIMELRYKQKYLALIRTMLERPVVPKAFGVALRSSGVPEKAAICKIMEEADLPINGTTIMRRSSTVRGWLEWIFSQLCLADQRELHLI